MKLDREVRERVAQKLNRPVPPPSDESFWELLEELRSSHPELAAELEENVIFDDLGDPEREAQRADARAVALRMGVRRLFYRFDEVRQTWYLHRGKLLGWGVGLFLAFFIPAFYLRPEPQTAAATPVAEVSGGSMSGGAVAKVPKLDKSPIRSRPEPLVVKEPRDKPAPVPLVAQPAAPTVPLTQPQVPMTAEPGSLLAYSREAATNSEVRGLASYRRNAQVGSAPQGESSDPFAESPNTGQSGGLNAYQMPQAETASAEPRGLSAYIREVQPNALRASDNFGTQSGGANQARSADPLFRGETVAPDYAEASEIETQAADPFAASPPIAQPLVSAQSAAEVPTRLPGELYRTGDTIEGELVVGVVALGGEEELPVIARGRDGSVWQGQAVLNAGGRVDITFKEAARDGGSQSLEAIALASDGYAGVPATVKETTPTLASDLARGALRGASEFVEGLSEQSSVTLRDGAAVLSRDAPPLDASVLGSVARLFTPPEGEAQQALVRLAEVPRGTKVQIMVLSETTAEDAQTP